MVKKEKLHKIAILGIKLAYFILLIGHLIAVISYGISWVFTTILFYSAFAYLIISALSLYINKYKPFKHPKLTIKHLKYYVVIFFTFFLLIDLGLRLIPKYKSYSESNYGWFYQSDYAKHNHYYRDIDNPYSIYQKNSNRLYKCKDFTFQHSYNELGIRDRNNIKALSKNKIVILTIGDSFTEGVGTSQDSTWQRFLEIKLNQDTSKYLVINAGISGSEPVHGIRLLEYLLENIKPNYVILSIGNSDFIDIAERGGFDNYKKRNKYFYKKPIETYFYSWSYIYRAIIHVIYPHPEIFMTEIEYNNKMKESSDIIFQAVEKLIIKSKEKEFKAIVLFYPGEYETEKLAYNYEGTYNLISRITTTNEVTVIDILNYYKQNQDSIKSIKSDLFWPNDGHNTISGYKIWSNILFPIIKNNEKI